MCLERMQTTLVRLAAMDAAQLSADEWVLTIWIFSAARICDKRLILWRCKRAREKGIAVRCSCLWCAAYQMGDASLHAKTTWCPRCRICAISLRMRNSCPPQPVEDSVCKILITSQTLLLFLSFYRGSYAVGFHIMKRIAVPMAYRQFETAWKVWASCVPLFHLWRQLAINFKTVWQ